MTKEMFLYQFDAAYDKDDWFIGLKNAVAGTTAEQADWAAYGIKNSIRNIVAHLNYYNHGFLLQFKGIEHEFDVASNVDTFDSHEDWEKMVYQLHSLMDEWQEVLSNIQLEKLGERVGPKKRPRWRSVTGISLHNAHHAGQIILIRMLQGSWNKTW
jgi:hypothetical protein